MCAYALERECVRVREGDINQAEIGSEQNVGKRNFVQTRMCFRSYRW